ncbi:sigma-70 family RNA polymerase sigma factor [Paenibacillus xylaniclasticus]|uniref:sigma-70 family RNA polymerase sigma factor n=1 Tax=Paenibacillus xylaniclasticus TaxID=588083 RepID=UPI000FD7549B|nr:sigma-70 family RNA polymerase sigma factor [Paenibacillus xylaniclasticus]
MHDEFFLQVESYLPALKYHCLKLTNNEWDAEDLMQEVLAKLYRSLQQAPDREISKAYVRQIAATTWIDYTRSKQAKISAAAFDELLHQPTLTPISEIAVREMFEQLADRLNVRQMVLILLVDIFQFTALETAQLIHSTQGAVKEGLKRARQRLITLAAELRDHKEDAPVNDRQRRRRDAENEATLQSLSKEMFEQFLAAFRAGDVTAICHSYLLLARNGVRVEKVTATGTRVFFTFRDPNGHLLGFVQQL